MKNVLSKTMVTVLLAMSVTMLFAVTAFAAPSEVLTQDGFKGMIIALLDSSLVAAALLTIGLAGILIELFVTGYGLAGIIGVGAFALYFMGNIWAGHVSVAVLLLFIVGLLMLIAEIFVTPGMGALGILGIAGILFSVFWAAPSAGYAVTAVLIAIVATIILVALSVKFGKTRKVWSRLVLSLRQENHDGYVAPNAELADLMGVKGVACTILRPAGTAIFNDKKIDVVTEGDFIEIGTSIEVIKIEGLRVVVRKVK